MEDKSEKRAVHEEELFRLLAENVLDYAIFFMDGQGRVETWTPGAERMLGYSEKEILGKPIDILFTDSDVAEGAPKRERQQAVERGRGEDDRWHVRQDGSRLWCSGVMTPLWDEGRGLRGFAKIMRDRTEWKLSEAARRASEARTSAVLETSLDGIITIDAADRLIEFNPAAERIFGFRRDEVLGRTMVDLLVPPRFREAHRNGMAHYLASGEGPVLGKRLRLPGLRADGTEFPIELSITRVPGEGPPHFTGFVRDITEQEWQEQRRQIQLRVSQVLTESSGLLDATPRILAAIGEGLEWRMGTFWVLDKPSQSLHCADMWCPAPGLTADLESHTRGSVFVKGKGIPGQVWRTATPLWIAEITPDDRLPRLALAIAAGLCTACAIPILIEGQVVGVLEFFGGTRREPDRELLKTLETIGGHIGQFVERKSNEAALQEAHNELEIRVARRTAELDLANQFLKTLLESLHDGIAACDAEGVLTVLNRSATKFHGLPHERVTAAEWAQHFGLYHADGTTPLQPAEIPLARALRGEHVEDAEFVIRSRDGRRHTLLASGEAFFDQQGKKLGAVVSMHDITERKRAVAEMQKAHQELEARVAARTAELAEANKSLQDADRRKNEFLAMLAHELRNPLTPIRAGLDLLAMEESSDHRQMVTIMQQQIEHLVRLVDDLLDVSRIIGGKIELRKAPADLAAIIQRSVDAVQPTIQGNQQKLVVMLPDAPVDLFVDSVRAVQVIANLLNNASKYTEQGGEIDLLAVQEEEVAAITIRDSGVGIDPELLPVIFDLFTQSDRSLDRSQGGLGIGLTLVKQLAELHGGSVEARSEGPGRGSEFIVRLPVAQPIHRGAAISHPSAASRGRRILVVDDNAGAAWMVSRLLQKLGDHQTETAHDGIDALAKIRQNPPEIALLDIGLPGMDGYEVAETLRRQAEYDDLLLIAMTGYGQQEDRKKAEEAGFDEHLTKPPSIDQMKSVLTHPKLSG